ncbi:MAG: PA0069 family radical SAM protein, partial [Janthinobacterium lividum]
MPVFPPPRGRGAPLNARSTRFDDPAREVDLDWLDDQASVDDGPPPLRTQVTIEHPRTIISRNASPDVPFDRSVNAYRGCEHGCIYCFARPTHAYLGLSPGLDFESRLYAKPDAPSLLRAELSKRGYRPAPLAMGTNTDPYQPIEARYRITRGLLEVLRDFRHPVTITTKSDRVVADLDLLRDLAGDGLVAVFISVTTLDRATARTLEPRAATPGRRVAAIAALAGAGIPTYVSVSPIVPAVTDHEIEVILEAAAAAGARGAFAIPIRLPHEVAPLFRAWLDAHHPDRAARVMSLVQSMRGG